MKKITCFALVLSLIVLFTSGCAKDEKIELLQTEHIPGTEVAQVHTPTPSVVPTLSQEKDEPVTATPTPFIPELITPMPTLAPEEPEFMNMYRAMPSGTRVNTEGIEEGLVQYCFYEFQLADRIRTECLGQAGLDLTSVEQLCGIRVLYYRSDGKSYICDVITKESEKEILMKGFYLMYSGEQKADKLPEELPALLAGQGYRPEILSVGSTQYLYIYR